MKRLSAAVLALLLATGLLSATGSPAQAEPVICETFGAAYIQNDTYRVQNNVWGADTAQCIDVNQSGGFTVTQAEHNKATNGAPASYPSIYAGCHYAECTAGSDLPMQASSGQFSDIRTSVSMSYPGSGTWNAAYDLWFDPTPRTDGQNTGAEMMVWLNRQGSVQPIGSPVATVNLAGAEWEVWFGNTGWNVISYLRTSPTTSVDFAVDTFYSDAVSRGYAERSWYLTSVQAGFEPWIGGAGLAVNSFSYTSTGDGNGNGNGNGGGGVSCTVTVSEWSTGYVFQVALNNNGTAPLNGWTVTGTLPGGHQLVSAWSTNVSGSGPDLTFTDAGWNGEIQPSQSADFGFQGSRPAGDTELPDLDCG